MPPCLHHPALWSLWVGGAVGAAPARSVRPLVLLPMRLKIQKAVRDTVSGTPLLTYFVVTIPGFLRYCRPEIIGLDSMYDGVQFSYQPPPRSFPKHTPRPLGFPSPHCSSCDRPIPKRASSSRRGIHPHAIYCAACGLAMRRAAARITRADDLLLNTYRLMPDTVSRFLRDDILRWLELP